MSNYTKVSRQWLILLFLLSATGCFAQRLTVESMEPAPLDLTAVAKPVLDYNNEECGLVKVRLAARDAVFEGNVIPPVEYKTGEYWVYLTHGTYRLWVKHPDYLPLEVNFRNYGIQRVESKQTYILTLVKPDNSTGGVVDDGMRYLVLQVNPQNAIVYVDDKIQVAQGGTVSVLLPRGQHTYRVESPGYMAKTGTVDIVNDKVTVDVGLESSLAQLTVSCPTSGAQIYVNEALKGTSPWTGTLAEGNYQIEARREGYRPQRQSITLGERDNQTITLPGLAAITGALNVNYLPANSEVWLDGERLGTSPDVFRNVLVGQHKVEVRYKDYQTFNTTVTIAEGQTATLNGSLSKDNAEELFQQGYNYYNGIGVKRDYAKAVECYTKAANMGFANAQSNLGLCYENGYGVPQSYSEAVKWYTKAAEQGNSVAQSNLGLCYDNGRGVAKSYTEAVKWYTKSAEQGNAAAQCYLGYCYYHGNGVAKSYTEAVKWYTKSAEQGFARAQCNLGYCYNHGNGVPQSYTEAVEWYTKAAEQGNASAQFNLGYCYAYGNGVPQSYTEAAKWYTKAAEQGDASAQNNLGFLYQNGNGVPKSIDKARELYQKAAAQGEEGAKRRLQALGD